MTALLIYLLVLLLFLGWWSRLPRERPLDDDFGPDDLEDVL